MKEELFPEKLIRRLSRLSIVPKKGRLGHLKGSHRSKKTGTSLDFSDFRQYHPGDDIRHIDWNVYARTEQPFIKQFLDEQEMRVHIVVDPTKSMGLHTKWDYARQLAICISHIALSSGDTVSISTWSNEGNFFIRKKGVGQRPAMTNFLATIDQPTVTSFFTEGILQHIPKAVSTLFIITDGLEETKRWEHVFKHLRGICHDIRLITLHAAQEAEPIFDGDYKFVDVESGKDVDVTVTSNRIQHYKNKKEEHDSRLLFLARKYGIDTFHIQTDENIMDVFTKKMRQNYWLT